MGDALEFQTRYGYLVLFGSVFAEQLGLPLPAIPLLLAAGALASGGHMSLPLATVVAVAASLAGDLIWYEIGRRRGAKVLKALCLISLEPDSCVRRTEEMFGRHGSRSLVLAKFIPGLNIAAPPLAGVLKMSLPRFLVFDVLGALLWVIVFTGIGYLFSAQLEQALAAVTGVGGLLAVTLAAMLGGYLGWKLLRRRRLLRDLRVARIAPEDLKRKIDSGEDLVVVDLRHALEVESAPGTIPGAMHLPFEEFERRHHEIPRGREVVLFCT